MKILRTIAFSCLFGGCSLVYGTGDLAHDAGVSDAANDAANDAGLSDAATDANDASDSDVPTDSGPSGDADAGPCEVEIEVLNAGWPTRVEFTFSDACPPMVDVEEPSGEKTSVSEGPYDLSNPMPLFGDRTLRVIASGAEVASIELPVSVEILTRIQGMTDPARVALGMHPHPQMDVDNGGNAVFITSEADFAAGPENERGAIVYWENSPALARVFDTGNQYAAPSISDTGGFVLFADRTSRSYKLANVDRNTEIEFTDPAPTSGFGHTDIRGPAGTTLRLLVHDSSQNYFRNHEVSATSGEFFTRGQGGPGLLGASGVSLVRDDMVYLDTSETSQGTTNGRSLAANGAGDLVAYVEDGTTLEIGENELVVPDGFGLASASHDLTTVLLRDSETHVFHVLRRMGETVQMTRLHINNIGTVNPADVSEFNSAAMSPDGRWAVFAFTTDGSVNSMRVARVRVQ